MNKASRNCPNTFKLLPKRRKFANSGHTGHDSPPITARPWIPSLALPILYIHSIGPTLPGAKSLILIDVIGHEKMHQMLQYCLLQQVHLYLLLNYLFDWLNPNQPGCEPRAVGWQLETGENDLSATHPRSAHLF